jgi:hypothetical protein
MKKMKSSKFLGVWIDESIAHLVELRDKDAEIRTIESDYKRIERIAGEKPDGVRVGHFRASNNEYSKHMRKDELQAQYYKKLMDEVKRFDEILLFGPTRAKNKLFNLLNRDSKFANKKIHMEVEVYMTRNQMKNYVKKYYRNLYELQLL